MLLLLLILTLTLLPPLPPPLLPLYFDVSVNNADSVYR